VALVGALDALVAVAVPFGVLFVVALMTWAVDYGLRPAWTTFYRAAVDVWMLGLGVDVRFTPGVAITEALGGTAADASFSVTLAGLGGMLVLALFGVRAGRRLSVAARPVGGIVAGVVVVAGASIALVATGSTPSAQPSIAQAVIGPALIYAIAQLIGVVSARPVARGVAAAGGALVRLGIRVGIGSVAGITAASGVAVAVLLVAHFATVVGLSESLHAGATGGLALTVLQLLLLPTIIVWAAAWFVGPGFALGAGSSVGPLGTTVGPLPSLPILGALPTGSSPVASIAVLVPVVITFVVAAFGASRLPHRRTPGGIVVVGVVAGLAGGAVLGILAVLASGAVGPGRLGSVGPNPLLVAVAGAVEIAVPAVLGWATGGRPPKVRPGPSYLSEVDRGS
jgi:Family of unknown function (DUF6350)